jgi:hypothetical protein
LRPSTTSVIALVRQGSFLCPASSLPSLALTTGRNTHPSLLYSPGKHQSGSGHTCCTVSHGLASLRRSILLLGISDWGGKSGRLIDVLIRNEDLKLSPSSRRT